MLLLKPSIDLDEHDLKILHIGPDLVDDEYIVTTYYHLIDNNIDNNIDNKNFETRYNFYTDEDHIVKWLPLISLKNSAWPKYNSLIYDKINSVLKN